MGYKRVLYPACAEELPLIIASKPELNFLLIRLAARQYMFWAPLTRNICQWHWWGVVLYFILIPPICFVTQHRRIHSDLPSRSVEGTHWILGGRVCRWGSG